jgi:hypothetical protein
VDSYAGPGQLIRKHLQTRQKTFFGGAVIKLRFLKLRPVLRDNQRVNWLFPGLFVNPQLKSVRQQGLYSELELLVLFLPLG